MMDINRRDILLSAAAATAAAALPAGARAAGRITAGPIAIHDPAWPASTRLAAALGKDGARAIAIDGDIVRQWNAGLRGDAAGAHVTALLPWHHIVLLSGLLREERRHVKVERASNLADSLWLLRTA